MPTNPRFGLALVPPRVHSAGAPQQGSSPSVHRQACPANCGSSLDGLTRIHPDVLGISERTIKAAKVGPRDQLLHCRACGLVWRRTFDTHLLRFRKEKLGALVESDLEFVFTPESWLKRAVADIEARSS